MDATLVKPLSKITKLQNHQGPAAVNLAHSSYDGGPIRRKRWEKGATWIIKDSTNLAMITIVLMGSGHFASEGGKAAFIRNIKVIEDENKLVTPNPMEWPNSVVA
uniref:Neprosin PEP catalytic domain-containing protein n=1 Tax=Oryza punctata TaxID=4537 RepID=A0A0E0K658_ORYPU